MGVFECKGVKGSGHLCFNITEKMIVPESYKRFLLLPIHRYAIQARVDEKPGYYLIRLSMTVQAQYNQPGCGTVTQ